jgi:hypothetical protein
VNTGSPTSAGAIYPESFLAEFNTPERYAGKSDLEACK